MSMKSKRAIIGFVTAVPLASGCLAAFLWGAAGTPLRASSRTDDRQPGRITKECSQYTGGAGSFCTITSSNVPFIRAGAIVFYDQAAGIPAGLLDSNVVLDAGHGNRALGRCTLDNQTGLGLCTFSDGTGNLAGFHARFDVTPPTDGLNWHWSGTYSFASASEQ
jgi:hypothetical protein